MTPFAFALDVCSGVAALLTVVWLVSLAKKDVSIVDIFWGPAFVVVAGLGVALGEGLAERRGLVLGLVAFWGLRLAAHLAQRSRGRGEDYRYAAMREKSPRTFPFTSLFSVFLLQGVLVAVISLPIQSAAMSQSPLGALDVLGAILALAGVLIEATADIQLSRFMRDPTSRGRVLDQGLWRYSRHPNYFGDSVVWWGFGLIGISTGSWWTVLGPFVMTVLLLKVSGVSLLEKTISNRRPEYVEYVRRTSAFFPLPPRSP